MGNSIVGIRYTEDYLYVKCVWDLLEWGEEELLIPTGEFGDKAIKVLYEDIICIDFFRDPIRSQREIMDYYGVEWGNCAEGIVYWGDGKYRHFDENHVWCTEAHFIVDVYDSTRVIPWKQIDRIEFSIQHFQSELEDELRSRGIKLVHYP